MNLFLKTYEVYSDAMYVLFFATLALIWWLIRKPRFSYEKFVEKEILRLRNPATKLSQDELALAGLAKDSRAALETTITRDTLNGQRQRAVELLKMDERNLPIDDVSVSEYWQNVEKAARVNEIPMVLLNEYRLNLFGIPAMPENIFEEVGNKWLEIEGLITKKIDGELTVQKISGDYASSFFGFVYTALALDFHDIASSVEIGFRRTCNLLRTIAELDVSPSARDVEVENLIWDLAFEAVREAKSRGILIAPEIDKLISLLPPTMPLLKLLEGCMVRYSNQDHTDITAEYAAEYLTAHFQSQHRRPKTLAKWVANLQKSEINELDLIGNCINWLRDNPADYFDPDAAKHLLDQKFEGLNFAAESIEGVWLEQGLRTMQSTLMRLPINFEDESTLPDDNPLIRVEKNDDQITCRWRESHPLNLKRMCGGYLIEL